MVDRRFLLPTSWLRALFIVGAAAMLLASLAAGDARAQEPLPSITISQVDASGYPELTAVVTVLDANGAPAQGLAPEAFSAADGATSIEVGGAQRVLDASLGLGVMLVIDVSGSMEGAPLAAAKEAATAFVRQLDAGDEAAVIAFNDDARLVLNFTSDTEALAAAINGLVAGGATSLYEAVQVGVFAARSSGAPRQAVVMLSDGENDTTTSTTTEVESLDSARGGRVPFYTIAFGTGADPAYLQQLAAATGGRFFAAGQAEIAGVYTTIAEQLRGQYALTLLASAEEDGGEGSLVVAVDVAGQRIESAPASFVRGEAPPAPVPTAAPTTQGTADDDGGGGSAVPLTIGGMVAVVVAGGVVVLMARRYRAGRAQRERERYAGRQSDAPLPEPAFVAPQPHAQEQPRRIVGVSGEDAGASYAFGSAPIVLGSDAGADVRLPRSREVAAKHAMLWVRDGKIMLRHTGGARPTLAAGRPVDWLILEEGDEFSIGPYRYRVEGGAPTNGATPSAGRDASS